MNVGVGILTTDPTALAVGQTLMALATLASFYWAYRATRPLSGRALQDLRQDKTEDVLGLKALCNPGRRSTDRCSVCPMDERCLKSLPPLDTAEMVRDRAAALALAEKTHAIKPAPSVLIVDDNEHLGVMAQTLLGTESIASRVATSVEAALPIRENEMLLITDWRFPEGPPHRLIAAFRQAHPTKPVIVMSAMDKAPEGLPPYVTWVSKPFEVDPFLTLVKQLMKG